MPVWLIHFAGRLRAFLRPGNLDHDFDQELETHLDLLAEEHSRRGMSPEQARRAARLELGGLAQLREAHREVRGMPWLADLFQDLQGAVRTLAKTPRFTATALAVLALGMGAVTAIFAVVNAVLLKPMAFPDPDRLVVLMSTVPQVQVAAASPAKFQYWRSQSDVLQDVTAIRRGVMNYSGEEVAEQVQSTQVSADFFHCFGIPTVRGRSFSPAEDLPDGPRVVVISDAFWLREFARDPRMIGQSIALSGDQYRIIGVRGNEFESQEIGSTADVYVPFQLDPGTSNQGNYFVVMARLKPGVSLVQAKSRIEGSAGEYRARFPGGLPPNGGFSVMRYREALIGNAGSPLLDLAGAVSFVLLVACANVANLLLARAAKRRREIGIRIAIGAGRARIVRQLLTESVLLSLAGAALGLPLGFVGMRALLAVNTAGLPRLGLNGTSVSVDWRVLSFTLLVSAIAGVVFGLIPAVHGSRADVNGVLKDGGGRTGAAFRQSNALSLLVIGEVSLAVVLVVGSVLLIRSAVTLRGVDPGFDTNNVLSMRMSVTGSRFMASAGVDRMVRDGLARIRAIPGVVAASAACCVPLQGGFALRFRIAGVPQGKTPMSGAWVAAAPGYFDVYRIPIKRGRTFDAGDNANSLPVAVISETMAKLFWKDRDPLQDRIVIGHGDMKEFNGEPERRIIGIAGDIRSNGFRNAAVPIMYVPQGQLPDAETAATLLVSPMAWVVRTQGEPRALAGALQEQLRQSSGLPVSDIQTMDEIVSQSMSPLRFNTLLMTVFGSCAALLAAIGIYGLMAYSVEQRMQEIGVRMALGATAGQVKNAAILRGMRLALAGVAIGMASAFGLTRFIARFLFQIQPHDPMVFTLVAIVLSGVAFLAVWIPARRASRIDPAEALRYE